MIHFDFDLNLPCKKVMPHQKWMQSVSAKQAAALQGAHKNRIVHTMMDHGKDSRVELKKGLTAVLIIIA